MAKHKTQQEVVLYGTEETIQIPEIKVRYNRGKISDKINSSESTYKFLKKVYGMPISVQEQVVVLYLDIRLNILGYYKHTVGTPNSTMVDIPMILGIALKSMAQNIIISHNHPSNNTEASEADRKLTKSLHKAAQVVGIKVLDHLIVTKDKGYYSFADSENILSGLTGTTLTAEEQLRLEIQNQLNRVTPSNAPNVYRLLQTQGGYANMEQRTISLVVRDKITPSACIPQIENEL